MKNHAVTVLFLVALLVACPMGSDKDDDKGDNGKNTSGIDFASHDTGYSILISNNTGEKLVAFKGDLQPDKLVGGIPANAQNHGLPKVPALFDKTEDFPLILLTESQYNDNKSNLVSQRNIPFTRLLVFYDRNGDNTVVYEIAAGLGGSNELHVISLATSRNIELRVNGVAGETIGYAPAVHETIFRLKDGIYNVFPVVKRYNPMQDMVETIYLKAADGSPWFKQVVFGEGMDEDEMNLDELLQGLTMTSSAAWVVVKNQTEAGIRFVEGENVYTGTSGLSVIMDGTERTFQIEMPKVGENYADSKTVSNWKFGPPGYEVSLQVSDSDNTEKGDITIKQDMVYTITVTGDHTTDVGIHAYISDERSIDTSDFDFDD